MSERDIFLAVFDLPDPSARSAYLDEACKGDTALRARVEALLRSHETADSFLGTPVVATSEASHHATRTLAPTPPPEPDAEHTHTHDGTPRIDGDDALAFLAPPRRAESLGRIGHYEVLEVLGQGGFGIVYRAFDEVLQRVVAVKVLAPSMAATSPARKRFLREARSSAQIKHDNIVQIHATEEQPLPFLVMEFIPGETLQQRLDRTGPLDVPEVLRIGRQIAEGLAAAHATGLIHRDIKPSNILIDDGAQPRVKITDFGLARAADDASISQSGVVAGTPMYMAPEQAKGDALDHRADLFSLGSVLYVMCTGRPPFRASGTLAVLKRVAEEQPRPIREVIPEVPEWLCRIIEKLHAKDPAERFQSAKEVAEMLADCEKQLATHKELKDFARIPEGRPGNSPQPNRLQVAAGLLGLFLAVGLVFGTITLFWYALGLRDYFQRRDTAKATFLLTCDDPDIYFTLEGQGVSHTYYANDAALRSTEPLELSAGEYTLRSFRGKQQISEDTFRLAAGGHRHLQYRPSTPSDSFVPLFNGTDLTGWVSGPNSPGKWRVENGELIGTDGPGYLYSANSYENFHLRVQVQVNATGNGGIVFRRQFQTEIRDDPPCPTGSIIEVTPEKTTTLARYPNSTPTDAWFTLELRAEGPALAARVNDGPWIAAKDTRAEGTRSGPLQLEAFTPDTVVRFNKIEIKDLTAAPALTVMAREEAARLNGEWIVRRGRLDGEQLTDADITEMKLSLTDGKFTLPIRDDSGYPWALTGAYTIDAAKKQLAFKFNHEPFDNPAVLCNYRIDGDALILDFPEPKVGEGETGSTELFARGRRVESQRNLKSLGVAMHNYMTQNKDSLPTDAIRLRGKPLLSWRVALLPYLGEEKLHKQFKLDEQWDSEHNKKLIEKMPKVYAIPGAAAPAGHTHYRVFVGPGTAFEPSEKGLGILDFFDGSSNTILVVEAAEPAIWTRPDDLPYDPKKPLPKLGVYQGGAHVLMGDGSVRRLAPAATEKDIRAAIEHSDDQITPDQLLKGIPSRGPAIHLEFNRAAAPPLTDKERLNGEWIVRRGRLDREPLADGDLAKMELSLTGGVFTVPLPDAPAFPWALTGSYTVDTAKKQLALSYRTIWGQDDPVICTYRIDGDALVLDFSGPKEGERPTSSPWMFIPHRFIRSQINLKQLGLAMDGYMQAYGTLPPAAITDPKDKDRKPLLSWRVAILPFIEQDALYKEFKLNEPWDSEHNKKLIDKMPKLYAMPDIAAPDGHTHYQVFVGPGTAFDPREKGLGLMDFKDSLSKTILVGEAADPVIWTKPDDLPYDPKKPLPKLAAYPGSAKVVMGNASVWRVSPQTKEEAIRRAIERNNGDASSDEHIRQLGSPVIQLELQRRSAKPAPPAKGPNPAVLQPLRDLVTAAAKSRDTVKTRLEAGAASKLDLVVAEIDLTEARIRLAREEEDQGVVVGLHEVLLAHRQEERDLIAQRVKAGLDAESVLAKANARLADAKARLAKEKPPVPAAPEPRRK